MKAAVSSVRRFEKPLMQDSPAFIPKRAYPRTVISMYEAEDGFRMLFSHPQLTADQDICFPFAVEDWLCQEVGAGRLPSSVIHLWRHERAFVLGLRDSRLPQAPEAMEWLEREEGYRVMVRHSGGAAVPLDFGVVNITLIRRGEAGQIGLSEDFSAMADLLSALLAPFGITFDTGEIAGSYCPGDFDLSIGGRKFCGLAQRRRLRARAVQCFVNAEGDSAERALLVREFYRRASGGKMPPLLHIEPVVMGSLTELSPGFPGAAAFMKQVTAAAEAKAALPAEAVPQVLDIAASLRFRYDPRCRPR